MRIAVIGCGYVGLVSGAGLTDFGHEVFAFDVDRVKIWARRGLGRHPGLAGGGRVLSEHTIRGHEGSRTAVERR